MSSAKTCAPPDHSPTAETDPQGQRAGSQHACLSGQKPRLPDLPSDQPPGTSEHSARAHLNTAAGILGALRTYEEASGDRAAQALAASALGFLELARQRMPLRPPGRSSLYKRESESAAADSDAPISRHADGAPGGNSALGSLAGGAPPPPAGTKLAAAAGRYGGSFVEVETPDGRPAVVEAHGRGASASPGDVRGAPFDEQLPPPQSSAGFAYHQEPEASPPGSRVRWWRGHCLGCASKFAASSEPSLRELFNSHVRGCSAEVAR